MDIQAFLLPLDQLPHEEPKRRVHRSCLQDMLLALMNERGLRDADVIRATGIPWSTWMGWITGEVNSPLADENLKKVWIFINTFKRISLQRLIYGIDEIDDFKDEKYE